MNNHAFDLKNAAKFLLEIITHKINNDHKLKLYNKLIKEDIDPLKIGKGKGKDKRHNILNIVNNIE